MQNPTKLPVLALLKVWNEWRPYGVRQTFLLIFAALGLLFLLWRVPRAAAVYFCILTACTLSIAITWSVGGRFLVPVLPVAIGLSSLGMWGFIILATELIARKKHLLTPPRIARDDLKSSLLTIARMERAKSF